MKGKVIVDAELLIKFHWETRNLQVNWLLPKT